MYICNVCGNREGFMIVKVTTIYQEQHAKTGKIEINYNVREVVFCDECKGVDIEVFTQ